MRWCVAALMVAISPVAAASLSAQPTRPCPPPATRAPYLVCQLDRPPRPDSINVAPSYPATLLQAAVRGTLRVSFVVNMSGRVDPTSFTVMDSAHALFITATKTALETWSFEPGLREGRAVPVRWEQIITFSVPRDSELPPFEPVVLARDTSPDGLPRLVVGLRDRESSAIVQFTNGELLDAQRSILAQLVPPPIQDSLGRPRVTVGLTINRGGQDVAADSTTLAALEVPGRHMVIPRDCPVTYEMLMYDTRRRPPGYIDPYIMEVPRVMAWSTAVLLIQVDVTHPTTTTTYRCWATRGAPSWRPTCRRFRSTSG